MDLIGMNVSILGRLTYTEKFAQPSPKIYWAEPFGAFENRLLSPIQTETGKIIMNSKTSETTGDNSVTSTTKGVQAAAQSRALAAWILLSKPAMPSTANIRVRPTPKSALLMSFLRFACSKWGRDSAHHCFK